MSNTNYDVERSLTYSDSYRHYIPYYTVAIPYYSYDTAKGDRSIKVGSQTFLCGAYSWAKYDGFINFDNSNETQITIDWFRSSGYGDTSAYKKYPPEYLYNDSTSQYVVGVVNQLPDTGVFSKVYFRNPNRNKVNFSLNNCAVKVNYRSKAPFEIQINSSGYISTSNPSFKCSTIEKNTYKQYEWTWAQIYYKKSTESDYHVFNNPVVAGTWSDVTVTASGLTLESGYTYNVIMYARADDGTTATSAAATFYTTDGTPTTTCVSPVGVYTNGTINFVWSHATEYGTTQYAYDLQYSSNNGGSWTTVANHVVSSTNNRTVTISSAGTYIWRVRTYNTMNTAGSWASATFINTVPATTPTNFRVTTKGRPTASWTSTTQAAYQVQVLQNDEVIYDSGAVYTGENSHFINQYFDDSRSYTARVRIYNALGSVSSWAVTGYQQPEVEDVEFTVDQNSYGGADIVIADNDVFSKYYIKRNDVIIAEITDRTYTDKFAVGVTNYSVVAVTSEDQSDIKTAGIRLTYPCATVVKLDGGSFPVNKRVNSAFEIQTTNEADYSRMKFIGASKPAHFFNKMKLKSFSITCYDDQEFSDDVLGTIVFYADNFGNGGYCMVTNYDKTDNFVQNSAGQYANEVSMVLEVTNYDDSIGYSI